MERLAPKLSAPLRRIAATNAHLPLGRLSLDLVRWKYALQIGVGCSVVMLVDDWNVSREEQMRQKRRCYEVTMMLTKCLTESNKRFFRL